MRKSTATFSQNILFPFLVKQISQVTNYTA